MAARPGTTTSESLTIASLMATGEAQALPHAVRRHPNGRSTGSRPGRKSQTTIHDGKGVVPMAILGLILLIIGLIANLGWLTIIGAILLVVGLILNFVPIGGTRRRYY